MNRRRLVSNKPSWLALEALLSTKQCEYFMYMGATRARDTVIHFYKHKATRRYLNLSDDGRAWRYEPGSTPDYVATELGEAIRHVCRC